MTTDHESVWKELLDQDADRALAFFYPDIHADVDWTREVEWLEQEFRKLAPDAAEVTTTVAKTSAGASEYLPVAKVVNVANTLEELKQKGFWMIGTDPKAERLYTEVDYAGSIAVVIGNEGKGIRPLVKEKCDFLVKIPLFGSIESLNASVAGALILYEGVRKRKKL